MIALGRFNVRRLVSSRLVSSHSSPSLTHPPHSAMNTQSKIDDIGQLNALLAHELIAERQRSTHYVPGGIAAGVHMTIDGADIAPMAQLIQAAEEIIDKICPTKPQSSAATRRKWHSALATVVVMAFIRLPLVLAQPAGDARWRAFDDWSAWTARQAVLAGLTAALIALLSRALKNVWAHIKDKETVLLPAGFIPAIEVCRLRISSYYHGVSVLD